MMVDLTETLIAGQTGCFKTTFVQNLVKNELFGTL